MEKNMILYHGSKDIITCPEFGTGSPYNDYGRGFYCTESLDLAREWACLENRDGFANKYAMDLNGLSIMKLTDGSYNILNWLSILLMNRKFNLSSDIAAQGKAYLVSTFLPPYEDYDVIIGYRADDSYFSFAEAFVENSLPLRRLETALHLGKLGEQTALVSEAAFDNLRFIEAHPADASTFYPRFKRRDEAARCAYRTRVRTEPNLANDLFVLDLMRGADLP